MTMNDTIKPSLLSLWAYHSFPLHSSHLPQVQFNQLLINCFDRLVEIEVPLLLGLPGIRNSAEEILKEQATKRMATTKAVMKPNVRPRITGRLEALVGASVVTL